jgi:hypothetical protein
VAREVLERGLVDAAPAAGAVREVNHRHLAARGHVRHPHPDQAVRTEGASAGTGDPSLPAGVSHDSSVLAMGLRSHRGGRGAGLQVGLGRVIDPQVDREAGPGARRGLDLDPAAVLPHDAEGSSVSRQAGGLAAHHDSALGIRQRVWLGSRSGGRVQRRDVLAVGGPPGARGCPHPRPSGGRSTTGSARMSASSTERWPIDHREREDSRILDRAVAHPAIFRRPVPVAGTYPGAP